MDQNFRDRLIDPALPKLYDYWRSKRRDGIPPGRQDIDPTELRGLLRHVVLADVVEGGTRIRYRLVGTDMVRYWGRDFTGCHADEIMDGSYRDFLQGLFRDVITQRCPVYSRSRFRWDVGRVEGTERLFMPLSTDGKTVDMIFIAQAFTGMVGDEVVIKVADTRNHEETLRLVDADG